MSDLPNVAETDFELKPFEAARILNDIIRGRSNNTDILTLSANSDSTTISNNLFESQMTPVLVPTTANAALESWYIAARSQGSFTINHTNNGQTDRTYLYIWIG